MQPITILFLVLSVFAVVHAAKYDSKYDNFDIDSIIGNQRILKNYIKCVLEKGPCTAEGKDFKRFLPEIMETSCSKCTPNQKRMMKKMTIHLRSKQAQDWEKIIDKYDKDGKYRGNFDKFLAEN